jgi:HSP20 family protein
MNSYNPLRELGLSGRLLNLADAIFRDTAGAGETRTWSPPVNISEDEQGYHLTAELPDVPPADVKVVVRDGVLTVKGERKFERKSDTTRYHLVERSYGSFSRSFTLPKDADGDRVSAQFANGVLSVTVTKRVEVQPREIEVKVN